MVCSAQISLLGYNNTCSSVCDCYVYRFISLIIHLNAPLPHRDDNKSLNCDFHLKIRMVFFTFSPVANYSIKKGVVVLQKFDFDR